MVLRISGPSRLAPVTDRTIARLEAIEAVGLLAPAIGGVILVTEGDR